MTRLFVFVALSGLALSAPAQDLTITFKSTDGGAATHYFTKDRLRMNEGRNDTMLELSSGKIVHIDHQKKEYSEMTLAEIDAAMKDMAAQMEQAMAQVPAQMRGQMAKMMGGAAEEVTVTKGAKRTIAGYSCETHIVAMGSTMRQETCNTMALVPPFDPAHLSKLARVTVPMTPGTEQFSQKASEIKGLALLQHTTIGGRGRKSQTQIEATEISRSPIAQGVFTLPAGYKKVASPLKSMKMTQ